MRIPLFQVDAFTKHRFAGNPAAVCPLAEWLDEDILRKVAAENNLSETAYFIEDNGGYELRWFTPRSEVELCGHATLASAHVLLTLLHPELQEIRFKTRFSGLLTVTRQDDLLSMDFPAMPPEICSNPSSLLLRGLGATVGPVSLLEANRNYLAVYENPDTVRNLSPDFGLLEQLHPYGVIVTAPDTQFDFISRYFAPSYGIPEDPVTGSSHCALAPYWSGRLRKPRLHAFQASKRGGEIWCEVAAQRVLLKGHSVLTMQGELNI
jgi:PhzF family phenazine biosynthesis protein